MGFVADAIANNAPRDWNGAWSGGEQSEVRLVLDEAGNFAVHVDGASLEITSVQVSPDRRTIIAYWTGGEGTFVRSDDGSVVASFFDRRFPIRMVRLERSR